MKVLLINEVKLIFLFKITASDNEDDEQLEINSDDFKLMYPNMTLEKLKSNFSSINWVTIKKILILLDLLFLFSGSFIGSNSS